MGGLVVRGTMWGGEAGRGGGGDGIDDGMKITMDSAGRLVLPKAIREESGLLPGVPLTVRCVEGRIEIEPAPRAVELVRKGSLLVAVPAEPAELLREALVAGVRDDLRRRAR